MNKYRKLNDVNTTAGFFFLAKWGGGGGEGMEQYPFGLWFAFSPACIQPRSRGKKGCFLELNHQEQAKVVSFESIVFKIALEFAFTRG